MIGRVIVALALCVSLTLPAQEIETVPLKRRPTARTVSRTIEGRVMARDGATVEVALLQRGGTGIVRRVTADDDGRFVVDVTRRSGPAVLRFSARGAATELMEIPAHEVAGALQIEPQVLDPGRKLSFRVEADGAELSAVAYEIRGDGVIDGTRALVAAEIGNEGLVSFSGLPARTVWVEITAGGFARKIVLADPLSGVVSGGVPRLDRGEDLLLELPARQPVRFTGELVLPIQVPGENRLLRRWVENLAAGEAADGGFGLLDLPPCRVSGWIEPQASPPPRPPLSASLDAVPGGAPLQITWTPRAALPELTLLTRPDRRPVPWSGIVEDASGRRARWSGSPDFHPLAQDRPVTLRASVGGLVHTTKLVGPFGIAERVEVEIGDAPVTVDAKVLQGSPRAGTIDRDPLIAWRRDEAAPWIVIGKAKRDPAANTRVEIPAGRGELVLLGLGERVGVPLPVEGAAGERLSLRLTYDVAGVLTGTLANDRRGAAFRGRDAIARLAPHAGAPAWLTAECRLDAEGGFRFAGRLPGRRHLTVEIGGLAPHVVEDLDVSTDSALSINGFDLQLMQPAQARGPAHRPVLIEAISSEEAPRVRLVPASGRVNLKLRPQHRYRVHSGWKASVPAWPSRSVSSAVVTQPGVVTSRGRGPAQNVLLVAEPGVHPVGGALPHTMVRHERGEWSLELLQGARFGLAVLGAGEPLTRFGPFEVSPKTWVSIDVPAPLALTGNMIGRSDRPVPGAELFAWPERDRLAPGVEPPPLRGFTDRQGRIRLPRLPAGVTRVIMKGGAVYRDHLVDNEDSQRLTNEPLRPVPDYGAALAPEPFARWYAEDGRRVTGALDARRALRDRLFRVVPDHRSRADQRSRPTVFSQLSPPLRARGTTVSRRLQLASDSLDTDGKRLRLIPLIGDEIDPGRSFVETLSGEGSAVELKALQPGSYLLMLESAGTQLVSTWQVEATGPVTARLELPTTHLEIRCLMAGSEESLGDVQVEVERIAYRDGRRIPVAAARAARVATRRTGGDGRCGLLVPAGEALRIRAWREAEGDVAHLDLDPLPGGVRRHQVTLSLEPGFRVSGEVRSSGRHPLPGAWLRLLDADGRDLWSELVTDSEGRFAGPPVPVSLDYRLEVRSRWITPWARTIAGGGAGSEQVVAEGSVVRRSYINVETPEGRPIPGAVLVPAAPDALTGAPPTQALPSAYAGTGWGGASRFVSGPTGIIELESFPTGISSWKVYAEGHLPVDVEIRGFWPRRRVIMERSRKR